MNIAAEAASLRKATRLQYKMARQLVQAARANSGSPEAKAELLKMAAASRDNGRKFRAKAAAYEASL